MNIYLFWQQFWVIFLMAMTHILLYTDSKRMSTTQQWTTLENKQKPNQITVCLQTNSWSREYCSQLSTISRACLTWYRLGTNQLPKSANDKKVRRRSHQFTGKRLDQWRKLVMTAGLVHYEPNNVHTYIVNKFHSFRFIKHKRCFVWKMTCWDCW